jgi:PAS domain S-box-containing protein
MASGGGADAPRDGAPLSEEHLRLAGEAGGFGTWEWHIPTNRVVWSASLETIHGLTPGSFAGTFEAFQKDMHPDDRARVLDAIARTLEHGEDHEIEYRILDGAGGVRWVEGRGKLFRNAAGAPARMIGVCMDVTARKRAEQALRDSEQRFARFMQQFPGLAWIKDAAGRYVYANDGAAAAFRRSRAELYGATDSEIFPPETAAQFAENDRRALASSAGIQAVETLEHADGVVHQSLVSKFPIPGPDGAPVIGGMAIDITELKRGEERQKLLLEELNHRVKNTLAIVQAIANLTLREAPDPAAFAVALSARLAALARAHSLLTRELWQGAVLGDVVAAALAPFGADGRQHAIRIDGPAVVVRPDAAMTLSLVLHELATNALKHGALTAPLGRVAVAWSMAEAAGAPRRVELLWAEHGGPPVTPPARQGFGSRLIAASAGQLGGEVDVRYDRAGVAARLRFPLTEPDSAPAGAA